MPSLVAGRTDNDREIALRVDEAGNVGIIGGGSADTLDTDGNQVPVWKGHIFTYDGSGNLETDTVTDGADSWVRTYVWTGGNQTSDSGWEKQ